MPRNVVGGYSRSHPEPWPAAEYCGVDLGGGMASFPSPYPTHVQFWIGPANCMPWEDVNVLMLNMLSENSWHIRPFNTLLEGYFVRGNERENMWLNGRLHRLLHSWLHERRPTCDPMSPHVPIDWSWCLCFCAKQRTAYRSPSLEDTLLGPSCPLVVKPTLTREKNVA